MTETPQPRQRLKDTLIAQIRDVDWTRSMARIVMFGLSWGVALLLLFMLGARLIHGQERGWLLSVAVFERAGVEVPDGDVP